MSTVLITQELFDNINFDTKSNNLESATTATGSNNGHNNPTVLIVFANSDINAALYYISKSLNAPFDPQAIATVLVQEAIKDDLIGKLIQQFKSHSSCKIKSNEKFMKALQTSKKLNAQLITVENQEENEYQPTLVCNFIHEQLGAASPSGIVTLHTFRTAKEAIALIKKESLKFTNVSIWHENHGHAYELVAALKSKNFFINCQQVPLNILEDSIRQGKNYVYLDASYHYETLQHDGIQKNVVFPIGSIFAN